MFVVAKINIKLILSRVVVNPCQVLLLSSTKPQYDLLRAYQALARTLVRSLSLNRAIVRSISRSLDGSIARSNPKFLVRVIARLLVRSIIHPLALSTPRYNPRHT